MEQTTVETVKSRNELSGVDDTIAEHSAQAEVCSPISALANVWTYLEHPPPWVKYIIELVPRSNLVVKNTNLNCHTESNKFTPNLRMDCQSVPRTLVCHDMKGGYLEDKFVGPVNVGNGYSFYRWAQIDIFVYFSHHLITLPPLSWINVAHANGVKILGTFITEWTSGEEICKEIFTNSNTLKSFVSILVDICVLFKLDGWLINIENNCDDVTSLKEFVKQLTKKLHAKRPGSLIIWYDSVIQDGRLKWQNELNDFNRCYFDVCDGIFINYSWNENNLANTVKAAEHRCLDVYIGVDVFGRNFYGGGHFNTYLAVKKIREYNLSMAIFGQGWTHESLNSEPNDTLLERFLHRDNTFWKSLWPYLYTHPITTTFQTFFYIGVDKKWFKLHSQEAQLSHFLYSEPMDSDTCSCLQLHVQDTYTSCLITKINLSSENVHIHHLFSCDIKINGNMIVYYYAKNIQENIRNDYLNLILLIKHANGTFQKVICHCTPQETLKNNFSILDVNMSLDQNVINMVTYNHEVPRDWVLRCYLLNFRNARILEVGAQIDRGDSVCLCGIGFRNAKMLNKFDS